VEEEDEEVAAVVMAVVERYQMMIGCCSSGCIKEQVGEGNLPAVRQAHQLLEGAIRAL